MSRGMWILAGLFAVLGIAMIYQTESGNLERPWAECKESLVTQMISGACTPRDGGLLRQSDDAPAGAPPPVDDGVTRVDRGG